VRRLLVTAKFLRNVGSYKSQPRNIPEDTILCSHRRENLKSYIGFYVLCRVQADSGILPSSFPLGTVGSFARTSANCMNPTTHLYLALRSRVMELYFCFPVCQHTMVHKGLSRGQLSLIVSPHMSITCCNSRCASNTCLHYRMFKYDTLSSDMGLVLAAKCLIPDLSPYMTRTSH
jgi:hypothetical protein